MNAPVPSAPEREALIAEHWAEKAREQQATPELRASINWLESNLVLEHHINPCISGQPRVNWFEWMMGRYVPMAATAACTLGCGNGGLERHARVLGFQASFDSFDISEGAVNVAREQAAAQGMTGIEYHQADLNTISSLPNTYQVVFASMSLHHIENLEALMRAVHEALVPGGRLIFNEFIGPRKFQWTDLQLAMVNGLLAALPRRLRMDLTCPGKLKAPVHRPTLEEMDAIDPSEAVLSDQIMPLAERYFRPVVRRDYGGTLLHLLLERIVGNFREDRIEDVEIMQRTSRLETLCLETGVLPSDFAVAVFEKDV